MRHCLHYVIIYLTPVRLYGSFCLITVCVIVCIMEPMCDYLFFRLITICLYKDYTGVIMHFNKSMHCVYLEGICTIMGVINYLATTPSVPRNEGSFILLLVDTTYHMYVASDVHHPTRSQNTPTQNDCNKK